MEHDQDILIEQHREIVRDEWILAAIILERFVTRLFSEKLGLLPSWTNFLDYPMLVFFAAYVIATRKRSGLKAGAGFTQITLALCFLFGISTLANLDRIHIGAASLFFVGLMEPLAFMYLAYAMNPRREVAGFLVKLLFFIGWLQIFTVASLDLPKFLATKNPDYISGTFGFNAYQMTFLLLAWNALVLSRRPSERYRVLWWIGVLLLQGLIMVIILLAQFRSLLPFALITWGLTYFVVFHSAGRAFASAVIGVGFFLALFFIINSFYPELKYNDFLEMPNRTDEVVKSGKVQSVLKFMELINTQPQVLLVGTGPGTYASRGFRTFSIAGKDDFANIAYREVFKTDHYITDVAARYVMPVAGLFAFGAATTADPFYSYLAIPAELGLLGLVMILVIYGKALITSYRISGGLDDVAVLARWVFIALLLLLQMAFIENWLEVSRLTVPVWTIFGVILAQNKTHQKSACPANMP